ncbi:ribonuclease H [Podospora conica]|nr:ribonuclease H [Schizothecium conicum]
MERSVIYTIPSRPTKTPHPTSPHPPLPFHPSTLFTPIDANLSPEAHFPLQTVFAPDRPPYPRFVNRFNPHEILLAVDGSCLNNGRHASKAVAPAAACAFLFKAVPSPRLDTPPTPVAFPFLGAGAGGEEKEALGAVAFRLEREGPGGEAVEHTSNRAKLRAVIAALQFRPWDAEGWRGVVVLTDLEYIVKGATGWVGRWVGRGWRKGGGRTRYANRDLWEALQERVEELRFRGCEVSFWLGKRGEGRGFLRDAKEAAKEAVRREGGQVGGFTRVCAFMI